MTTTFPLVQALNGADAAGITVQLKTITPQEARTILDTNLSNRRIKRSKLESLKRALIEGRWYIDGNPIRFNDRGELVDGQHRLRACVETGKSILTLVVYGIADEARFVTDTGTAKTCADFLTMNGEPNAASVAATLRLVWLYRANKLFDPTVAPAPEELLRLLQVEPGIRDSVRVARTMADRLPISSTTVAVSHFLTACVDPEDATAFWDRVASGADLKQGSTLLAYRRWIDRWAGKREKPSGLAYLNVTLKAMNYYRQARDVATLIWRREEGPIRVWGEEEDNI